MNSRPWRYGHGWRWMFSIAAALLFADMLFDIYYQRTSWTVYLEMVLVIWLMLEASRRD